MYKAVFAARQVRALVWVGALGLAGCATPPSGPAGLASSAAAVPAMLAASAVPGTAVADPGWHQVLVDARLQQVVALALANNRDLRLASLNIEAARARYRISEAGQAPVVNASAGGAVSRSAADLSGGASAVSRQLSVSLGVTAWELDLWGRLGHLSESARASYLQSEQTQRSVQTALVGEVAQAWLGLAAAEQRLQLATQTHDSRRQSLQLVQRRHELGAVSAADLAAAQAAAESARGDAAGARSDRAQALNALRLLVGADVPAPLLPAAGNGDATAAATLLAVPANLPSSVLLQRPDVRAAEQAVLAAQADLAATRAALFPTLSLTSSVGTASTALSGLFASGNSTWSLVPTLKIPMLDGGASRAAWEAAQVAARTQVTQYEKTLQTAFREAADSLAVRAELDERLDAQQQLVQASQRSLALTERRHQAGAETALAVLEAQRSLFAAQQGLITLRLTEQANRLTLYKVLGGA